MSIGDGCMPWQPGINHFVNGLNRWTEILLHQRKSISSSENMTLNSEYRLSYLWFIYGFDGCDVDQYL
jgi:hypothetical protein